jgi:hypothetical protein
MAKNANSEEQVQLPGLRGNPMPRNQITLRGRTPPRRSEPAGNGLTALALTRPLSPRLPHVTTS